MSTCETCNGDGYISIYSNAPDAACPDCNGKGQTMSQPYSSVPDTSARKMADKGDEKVEAHLRVYGKVYSFERPNLAEACIKGANEIASLRTQLASARKALAAIKAGYGSHHQSRFCDRIARAALKDISK